MMCMIINQCQFKFYNMKQYSFKTYFTIKIFTAMNSENNKINYLLNN